MVTPFTVNGSLQIPPDPGQPVAPIPFALSGQFDAKVCMELNLVGGGTHVVCFGTIAAPGAKVILIEVDADPAAAPIHVQNNGGAAGQIEIAPGGFIIFGNPAPVAGSTTMSIVHTTNNKVHIRILG